VPRSKRGSGFLVRVPTEAPGCSGCCCIEVNWNMWFSFRLSSVITVKKGYIGLCLSGYTSHQPPWIYVCWIANLLGWGICV
jgi:hypothetical protein